MSATGLFSGVSRTRTCWVCAASSIPRPLLEADLPRREARAIVGSHSCSASLMVRTTSGCWDAKAPVPMFRGALNVMLICVAMLLALGTACPACDPGLLASGCAAQGLSVPWCCAGSQSFSGRTRAASGLGSSTWPGPFPRLRELWTTTAPVWESEAVEVLTRPVKVGCILGSTGTVCCLDRN